MKAFRSKHRNRGFTLIELLASIAIIAIIVGLLVGAGNIARIKSLEGRAKSDLQHIANGLNEYYLKYSRYPADLNTPATIPDVMAKLPQSVDLTDPWNRPYVYETPVDRLSYKLYSRGRYDAQPEDDIVMGK